MDILRLNSGHSVSLPQIQAKPSFNQQAFTSYRQRFDDCVLQIMANVCFNALTLILPRVEGGVLAPIGVSPGTTYRKISPSISMYVTVSSSFALNFSAKSSQVAPSTQIFLSKLSKSSISSISAQF